MCLITGFESGYNHYQNTAAALRCCYNLSNTNTTLNWRAFLATTDNTSLGVNAHVNTLSCSPPGHTLKCLQSFYLDKLTAEHSQLSFIKDFLKFLCLLSLFISWLCAGISEKEEYASTATDILVFVPYHFFTVSFSALLISHLTHSVTASHTVLLLLLIRHRGTDNLDNL